MGHMHCEIGDTDFKLTWEPVFKQMSDAQIDKALSSAIRFTGFLKPGNLLEWGQKIEGMPSMEAAYAECCEYVNTPHRKAISHPGLLWVIQQTGTYELKTQTRDKVIFRFKSFYEDMASQVMGGRIFALPAEQQIEHKEFVPSDDDSPGRRLFKKCRQDLRQYNVDQGHKKELLS